VRLAYLAVSNAFTALRQLPMSYWDKDAEILALRQTRSRTWTYGDATDSAERCTNTNAPRDLRG
jgi:hypothetical protein